jgi:N-acetylneuraminic acid mutarotase
MKKLYTLTISLMLITNLATAQAPQGFKYQASIRDNNGVALLNKLVAIKISLLAGTANGTSVYSEVYNVVTSDFGIVNLNIGNGTVVSGNFNTIDWGNNTYFIKTEVDINNGTNFLFMGTSQLLSVPYAMFAAKSGNATNANNDFDKDSLNELQHIALNGNTLSITKGNSIVLSGTVDLDADPTNEIQTLTYKNDTIQLSKANNIVLQKDYDRDSLNELQTISRSNDTLYLSKGNFTVLPKVNFVPSGAILTSTTYNDTNLLKLGYTFIGGFQQNLQNQLDSFYLQWGNTITPGGTLSGRLSHTAIWTGSEMIIWGGTSGGNDFNDGAKYNPITNTWSKISLIGAPTGRSGHSAIWTGSEMIIWGGIIGASFVNDGARYNPTSDTWTPITSVNAPNGRIDHRAIWTSTEMIIWGGSGSSGIYFSDICKYNPITNTWTKITPTGTQPSLRQSHSAIWISNEMIIWGGFNNGICLNDMAKYNPITNNWTLMSTINPPKARYGHSTIWNGTNLIIWAGQGSEGLINDGSKYNLQTNSWTTISSTNAPSTRCYHSAIWTGKEMIVWGGTNLVNLNDGKIYGIGYSQYIGLNQTTFYLYRKN